jgi:hypothetical protein
MINNPETGFKYKTLQQLSVRRTIGGAGGGSMLPAGGK